MSYFLELLSRAFWDTWSLVLVRSLPVLVMAGLVFFGTLLVKWSRHRHEDAQTKVTDWLEAAGVTALVFAVVFVFHLLIWTPKKMVEEARRKAPVAPIASTDQQKEIDRLQAAVKRFEDRASEEAAREWRALTSEEITKWAYALRPFHIPGLHVYWNQDVDARKLFASIKAAAKYAGIGYVSPELGGADPGEIVIETQKGDPAGPVLVELCKPLTNSVKLKQGGTTSNILITLGEKPR